MSPFVPKVEDVDELLAEPQPRQGKSPLVEEVIIGFVVIIGRRYTRPIPKLKFM